MKSPSSSANGFHATPTDQKSESNNVIIQSDSRLSRDCPICDYPLVGLPVEHRCPECGFQFDAQTMIWDKRYTKRLRNLLRLLLAAYLGVFLPIVLVVVVITGTSFGGFLTFAISMVLCLIPFLYFNCCRLAAVSPSGVILRLGDRKSRTLPWDSIREVTFNPILPNATQLVTKRGRKIFVGEVLRSPQDVIQFTQAINDGIKRHGQPAAAAITQPDDPFQSTFGLSPHNESKS